MLALCAGARKSRLWIVRSLALLAGFSAACYSTAAFAAPPVVAQISDSEEETSADAKVELTAQEEPVATQPAPAQPQELPETNVEARGVYPANPLPADVAITPTRTETRIGGTGNALTVITQEEIQNSGKSNVAEVLRGRVPGLDVVRSGPLGGQTSVFMRGANSQQTKVLLDGIWINDPSSATRGFDFSILDVENIERIEILRGPQSLLYGSDAIGGVINIITKRGNGPSTPRASAYGGAFGTGRVAAGVSGGGSRGYYSIGGSYLSTDGISAASVANGNHERDGFKNGNVSGRFGYTPSDQVNVDYVFRYTQADAEIDDFDIFTSLPVDNVRRKNLLDTFAQRIQLQSLFLDGDVEQVVGFNLVNYNRDDTDSGPFIPPHFEGQSRMVDWLYNLQLTETNKFTVGTQFYVEEAQSTFNPPASQNDLGVFLQDQWQLRENWYAGFGARWDDNSRAGQAETYRFNTIYTVTQTNTDFHGSLGTGFRAPALAENLFAFGNPNLQPETSKGWDIGATQRLFDSQFSLDATYFRNDFTNLIFFDFNTFALANIGRARSSGVELTGNWQITDVTRLYANYTFTDTLDLDTGLPLLRRPRNKSSFGFDRYLWNRTARIGAQAIFVGERLDTNGFILGQYSLVNLNGSYYFTPKTELFARIDNATDQDYQEVRGFGVPGIAGYAGMNLTW
jgi:vitamin B12 transporter